MSKIAERLTRQLRGRGEKNPKELAHRLLNKMGHMQGNELTEKGKKRNAMSPGERAKSRQAKYSGGTSSQYKYDPKTNVATRKSR